MLRRFAQCLGYLALALLLVASTGARADGPAAQAPSEADLRTAVAGLTRAAGIAISGLERLEATKSAEAGLGSLEPIEARLKALLAGYNYLVLYAPDGTPRELRILGKAPDPADLPRPYVVKTKQRGVHHAVTASLVGPNGRRVQTELMLDTGATTVVLPASLAKDLGYDLGALARGTSRTANGEVPVRRARLGLVEVGHASARQVAVSFIEDKRLGKQALLGMSFLGRFRLSIDDAAGEITLISR